MTPWTVCSPTDSVHGILQGRILVWIAISSHRGDKKTGIELWGIPTYKSQEKKKKKPSKGERDETDWEEGNKTDGPEAKGNSVSWREDSVTCCWRYWIRRELKSFSGFGQTQVLVTLTSHWWTGYASLIGMGGEEHPKITLVILRPVLPLLCYTAQKVLVYKMEWLKTL